MSPTIPDQSSSAREERPKRYVSLEVGRGVAACLVTAYHASNMVVWSGMSAARPFGGFMSDFNAGVDFFFVLSGFLVSWVHWSDVGRPGQFRRYASRRFTRIYPVYWVVLLPLIGVDLLIARHTSLERLATSIFLLPDKQPPILGVAWSLVYEIFFYVVFGSLICCGRSVWLLFPIWAVAIIWYSVAGSELSYFESFLLNPYNMEFLFGVAAATLIRQFRLPGALSICVVGALTFLTMMIFHLGSLLHLNALGICSIYGFAAAAIICGLVELERRGAIRIAPYLGTLGGASYAIYLVHPEVYSVGIHFLKPYILHLSPNFVAAGFAFGGILVGVVFHLVVEKRVTRWSRSLVSKWARTRTAADPTSEEKVA